MINVGGATLEVIRGDITDQHVDAIVNAANNHLWMGAGVAGAIKRKGGDRIEHEAVSQGPIEVGQAVITSAGSLRARHVIHAAGMGQDLKTDVEKVSATTRNSLLLADANLLTSIALPAIGTGVGGLSLEACSRAMIDTVVDVLSSSKLRLKQVVFVLFDEDGHTTFQDCLRNRFSL
jgi:O-acetyl-ADP-ribose deacetylase (regulator of RNase III)